MNCQNGRHLFVIGRMDVLVNRIASQFHLKFQKKITNSRNELQLGYSHMNNRHQAYRRWWWWGDHLSGHDSTGNAYRVIRNAVAHTCRWHVFSKRNQTRKQTRETISSDGRINLALSIGCLFSFSNFCLVCRPSSYCIGLSNNTTDETLLHTHTQQRRVCLVNWRIELCSCPVGMEQLDGLLHLSKGGKTFVRALAHGPLSLSSLCVIFPPPSLAAVRAAPPTIASVKMYCICMAT